jgi:hypothetical protein
VIFELSRNERKAEGILQVKGFHEFPIVATRWKTIGSNTYGYGRGRVVLADVKMLQDEEEAKLEGIHKNVCPPMLSNSEVEMFNHLPGGNTPQKSADSKQWSKPAYQPQINLTDIRVDLDEVQRRIRAGFYNDFFLMVANTQQTNKTATEVAELHQEKLMMLSPVLTKVFFEKLGPTIRRSFNLLLRLGMLPPPPEEILRQGGLSRIKIVYSSMLAQAQKILGLRAVEQGVSFVGALGQTDPDTWDILNKDNIGKRYCRDVGMDESDLNSEEEIAEIRRARAEAQARQEQIESGESLSNTAKNLGSTPMGTDSALDALLGGALGVGGGPNA